MLEFASSSLSPLVVRVQTTWDTPAASATFERKATFAHVALDALAGTATELVHADALATGHTRIDNDDAVGVRR